MQRAERNADIIGAMPGVVSNLYATIEDAWRYESDYYAYRDDLPRIGELAKSAGGIVLELGQSVYDILAEDIAKHFKRSAG